MPTTQASLLTSIRDRLNEETARQWTDVQIRKWINEGVKDIARRTETLLARQDVAAVAGTQEYAFTDTAILRIHRVEYNRTGETHKYALEYRDFGAMDAVWGASQAISQGTPQFFTTWGYPPSLKLIVYPTPAAAGNLKVFYYKLPTDLATDGTAAGSNVDVPEGWTDLVVDYAEYHALRKDADPRWQEAKSLYEERLGNLYDNTRRFTDQAGMVVGETSMVPAWLYNDMEVW